jgi:hypothetical protein
MNALKQSATCIWICYSLLSDPRLRREGEYRDRQCRTSRPKLRALSSRWASTHHLSAFANTHGAKKLLQLAEDPVNWKGDFLRIMNDPNAKVFFNLDNVDVWSGVTRASSGRGGATDWELFEIMQNKEWWPRISWFKDGARTANPFE